MSDGWTVLLALATAGGAWASLACPRWLGLAVVAAALAARRPALLCVGAAVLASALGARSWDGLRPPPPSRVDAAATLVGDPVDVDGALRVEARVGGRRVEAWARGATAAELRPRLAGERMRMTGRLSALPERRRAHLAPRHIAARLTLDRVGEPSPGSPPARAANHLRRALLRGAASLPDEHRALFAGLVLGDDREQDPGTVDDFRATGLSHLLAVSGQNVAFVLALAAPVLRLLGLRGRFLAALAVLALFGLLTRWEPSVLRAEAMAAVSLLAVVLARPASTLRLLALAVTGLLLVDPLLVRSVGFVLSCGACAGIATLTAPLSRRLPLPLAVTIAAQAGVSPLLAPVFGGVPLVSVPANLLAAPVAGPVMTWGLLAGVPAGFLGGPVATVVHLPTRLMVAWVAGVARLGAGLPMGQLRAPHLVAGGVLAVVALTVPRLRVAAPLAGAGALVVLTVVARPPPVGPTTVASGAQLWRRGGAAVLVVERPRPRPLLDGLRRAGVRRIDVVAVTGAGRGDARSLVPVLERHPARVVLTPDTARPGTEVRAGGLRLEVASARPRLDVRVSAWPRPPPPPGGTG